MNPMPHDPPPAEDRFEVLWTDYLEEGLDAAGMAELDALLAADERLVGQAADLYQVHRRLGLLAAERGALSAAPAEAFVADVMGKLPADGETLTRRVMERLTAGAASAGRPERRRWLGSLPGPAAILSGGLLAALAIVFLTTMFFRTPGGPRPEPVRFTSLARASFLGRETPARQSEAVRNDTFVLSGGLVELTFPIGATAIIEGPAVFRVCGSDCLAVDAGQCSVHAPEGAEGFRVETPTTRVIDRGTRFVVNVGETAETEVQVIEGAADVFAMRPTAHSPLALTAGEAARIAPTADPDELAAVPAAGFSAAYQRQLPDRLVSYTASLRHPGPRQEGDAPGIDTLESVTVQRAGRVISYRADQLIGVELVHFASSPNLNNLVAPVAAAWAAPRMARGDVRRSLLEADRLLTSGIINAGGSRTPPSSAPLLAATADEEATPGIAVRFTQPVVNHPGPDVVFFDLQAVTDPPQGDAFHVGPLDPGAGLRWFTVADYDIDSNSPDSQLLARFRLFGLDTPATSLAGLTAAGTGEGLALAVRAKCNAVGIDLSALGYADGAPCTGLFFQDADDDKTFVDPTFVAGLPPLEPPAGGEATTVPDGEAGR